MVTTGSCKNYRTYARPLRSVALLYCYVVVTGGSRYCSLGPQKEGRDRWGLIDATVEEVRSLSPKPISYVVAVSRQKTGSKLIQDVVIKERLRRETWLDVLGGELTMRLPMGGIPVLFLVLYFALYRFVGVFGAGTVVDYIEGTIFQGYLNPWLMRW